MGVKYKNLIWTDHALTRMRERGVRQTDVWSVWCKPQKSKYAKTKAAWVYEKKINGRKIGIVAKKNEKGEWVILSVWARTTSSENTKGKNSSIYKLLTKFLRF